MSLSILLILNIILFYEIILNGNILKIFMRLDWFKEDILNCKYELIFDDLSSSLLLIVISVSLIVLMYSYEYMLNDAHLIRFFIYILLFVFCMILLITTSNIIILFIGWEGVGLSSFLLISYFYTRIETSLGGLLAIIMNRIGDIFFLLGIFIGSVLFSSLDIITMSSLSMGKNFDILLIFFFMAAMAKSAQLYLHIWLPFSMEGPTPISSLIHAATMVTAGIFLLLRLSVLLSFSYIGLQLCIIIGTLTTFIGGSLALTSLDMKELIAYSTMSQLGYMITIIGLKYYNLSFFHLLFHAYFKALLFLTAGCIIHTVFDIQDFRKSGSLLYFIPIAYIVILIGIASLAGIPFTTGFYSKESIINSSFSINNDLLSNYVYLLTLLTALLTMIYSLKFILTIFIKTTNLSITILKNLHFSSKLLNFSLLFISFITIFFGYFFSKYVYLYNLPINYNNLNLPVIIKLLPILFTFFVYYLLNHVYFYTNFRLIILEQQYYFKVLYKSIAGYILSLAYRIFFKIFDYGIIDLFFPIAGINILNISNKLHSYVFYNIKNIYIPYLLSGLIFIIYIL
jgi:NADH-ubiquinone oxidoreductase chain 5